MTIEKTVNKLLTNKYVLYFVLLVCVIQVLGYIKIATLIPYLFLY